MGNCLKSNKVEPFVVRNNSAEMLERGTPDRRSAKSKHADMIQDLMEEGTFKIALSKIIETCI